MSEEVKRLIQNSPVSIYDRVAELEAIVKAIETMGKWMHRSGMYRGTVDACNILAWHCFVEKKDPLSILREFHFYEGQLQKRADAMLAGLVEKGGKYRVLSRTDEKAEIEITHRGETLTFTLTKDDAAKEPFYTGKKGQVKQNYATPRARMQMLWARVVSDGVRTLAPEVVCGQYTPEEISDASPDDVAEIVDVAYRETDRTRDSSPSKADPPAAESSEAPPETPGTRETSESSPEAPPFDVPGEAGETPAAKPEANEAEAETPTEKAQPSPQSFAERSRQESLRLLKEAKTTLEEAGVLTADKWQNALAKRNVAKAKDLTDSQISGLLWSLWSAIEKNNLATDLDAWVNNALRPSSGSSEGN